ncbi:hypothetical protein QTP88_007162 [Uroleucon formosanum]
MMNYTHLRIFLNDKDATRGEQDLINMTYVDDDNNKTDYVCIVYIVGLATLLIVPSVDRISYSNENSRVLSSHCRVLYPVRLAFVNSSFIYFAIADKIIFIPEYHVFNQKMLLHLQDSKISNNTCYDTDILSSSVFDRYLFDISCLKSNGSIVTGSYYTFLC